MRKLIYSDAEFALGFRQKIQKNLFKGIGNVAKRQDLFGKVGRGVIKGYRGLRRGFSAGKQGFNKPFKPTTPSLPTTRKTKIDLTKAPMSYGGEIAKFRRYNR